MAKKVLTVAAAAVVALGLSAVAVSAAAPHSVVPGGARSQRLPTYLASSLTRTALSRYAAHRIQGTRIVLQTAHLTMNVMPGMKLAPDGKLHDAFSPSALTVAAGQKILLTVYNWDNMPHSFSSTPLHENVTLPPSLRNGQPSVTTIAFTAPTATFECIIPCDIPNHGWSMAHVGYMIGTVNVTASA